MPEARPAFIACRLLEKLLANAWDVNTPLAMNTSRHCSADSTFAPGFFLRSNKRPANPVLLFEPKKRLYESFRQLHNPQPTVLRGYDVWAELLSEEQLVPSQSRITLEPKQRLYES